jgi:PAS domain S-box-containing protein
MTPSRIFIVEDSFIVALHLQKTLENEGYTVMGTADSGEQALELLAQDRPDLVLMDIMLGGKMDGIQAAIIVKEKLSIPVVFITALTDKETIQRAKVAEPYGYLTKPFEDRDIFTVIEMALYKGGVERKLKQSEHKFHSTLKSISDGVLTMDNSYSITYANPSAEGMIGSTLANMQGKKIFDVFKLKNKSTGDFPVNPLQCGIDQRNVWIDNFSLQSVTGTEIPVSEGTVSPILDLKDKSIGLVLTFKNATDKLERLRLAEEAERQNLAALIQGQEKERTRIAKDLHDGLGQMLNAIKMNTRTFITDEQKAKDLFLLLDEAITETKRMSENLLPHKLKDFDLQTCLQSLCDQFQNSTSTEISFSSFTDHKIVCEIVKINLYRIAQEALNNAIRHSQARHISIQLIEEDTSILLTIEDDGKGMDRTKNSTGRGLLNIEDRARVLRATCTIESDRNRGTIIIIEMPKNDYHTL